MLLLLLGYRKTYIKLSRINQCVFVAAKPYSCMNILVGAAVPQGERGQLSPSTDTLKVFSLGSLQEICRT